MPCVPWLLAIVIPVFFCANVLGQDCPPNLDFETGTFQGWDCYVGTAGHVNGINQISLYQSGPVTGRHTLYKRSANVELDPYGGFPVICPNGSGYSIRLGNNLAGTEAEGVSYLFTIPANRNEYSLIYHYAVVFQDPSHQPYEQPRMEIEVTNLTDNRLILCSSFTFYPVGSPLPGFFLSQNPGGNTPVWCKNWTAVSVNLDGLAGKTIRMFFKTADCTFRRHFGYAYIDVNSECSGEFTGATFCRGDSAVQVEAPHGYQRYTWFAEDFERILDTQQVLRLSPAPSAGTTLAVEVVPFDGYGCTDTLYARLIDTMTVKALAGSDKSLCFGSPVELGVPPRAGVYYSWSPATGLSDPNSANPFANPGLTTTYTLTSRSYGGGCVETDSVIVTPVIVDSSLRLLGKDMFCEGYGDSAVLQLAGAEQIQWYRDNEALSGANGTRYRVNQSGTYHAVLQQQGCTVSTARQAVVIETPIPGISYPALYVVANSPATLQARNFGNRIEWQPATYLNSATTVTPEFYGTTNQVYTIQINTAAGCITVDTQAVVIVKEINILVPNAFTPNNDGRNDILRPFLFGIRELLYFRVYNRWGQLLYQTSTPHQGWNGLYAGKVQANQVVVWVAEGIGMDGKRYVRKGTSMCIQ